MYAFVGVHLSTPHVVHSGSEWQGNGQRVSQKESKRSQWEGEERGNYSCGQLGDDMGRGRWQGRSTIGALTRLPVTSPPLPPCRTVVVLSLSAPPLPPSLPSQGHSKFRRTPSGSPGSRGCKISQYLLKYDARSNQMRFGRRIGPAVWLIAGGPPPPLIPPY